MMVLEGWAVALEGTVAQAQLPPGTTCSHRHCLETAVRMLAATWRTVSSRVAAMLDGRMNSTSDSVIMSAQVRS